MIAIDTNVLIYRLDRGEPIKQGKAKSLLRKIAAGSEPSILPWQVLCELVRHLRYLQDQKQLTQSAVTRYINSVRNIFPIVMPTMAVMDRALALYERYSLSHWDSLLLGACQEASVTTLFTEDMGSPCEYDGIRLVNPFI